MGAIHFSIDDNLIRALQGVLPLSVFFEAGTFEGASLEKVRPLFKRLYSVEASEDYFQRALEKFKGVSEITLSQGDSAKGLDQFKPALENESVLYWLDAHWCVAAEETGGALSQCPLMEELEAIGVLNQESVILIDDARLFLAPPPAPHEISQWPDFDSIMLKLRELSRTHLVMVLNDVICFFPPNCKESMESYAQRHSFDLLAEMHKARHYEEIERMFHESVADRAEQIRVFDKLVADIDHEREVIRDLKKTVEHLQWKVDIYEQSFYYKVKTRLTGLMGRGSSAPK